MRGPQPDDRRLFIPVASGEQLRAAVHRGPDICLHREALPPHELLTRRASSPTNDADPFFGDIWLATPTWMQIFHEAGSEVGLSRSVLV